MSNTNDPLRTLSLEPGPATPRPNEHTELHPDLQSADRATVTCPLGQITRSEVVPPSVAVPGYEIEGLLGRGGMGIVYRAFHLSLKRTVALKMVLDGGQAGPQQLARFRVEAEAAARQQHPNIVQIHEVGTADGPLLALEFVEEAPSPASRRQATPAADAARLVESARAMQLAHGRNVIHRDLKPAGILLTSDGTPKITDFDLARQLTVIAKPRQGR